jgi:hypothetical protein
VTDPGNWWYDLDAGQPNEVSAALRRTNPYAGAQQAQQQLMDQNGAPLMVSGSLPMMAYPPPVFGYPPTAYPSAAYGFPQAGYGVPQLSYGYPAYAPPILAY